MEAGDDGSRERARLIGFQRKNDDIDAHRTFTFDLIKSAISSAFLLNGAAATALLAFGGATLNSAHSIPSFTRHLLLSLLLLGLGAMAAALAWVFAYFGAAHYTTTSGLLTVVPQPPFIEGTEQSDRYARRGFTWFNIALITVLLSLSAFAVTIAYLARWILKTTAT